MWLCDYILVSERYAEVSCGSIWELSWKEANMPFLLFLLYLLRSSGWNAVVMVGPDISKRKTLVMVLISLRISLLNCLLLESYIKKNQLLHCFNYYFLGACYLQPSLPLTRIFSITHLYWKYISQKYLLWQLCLSITVICK